MSILIDIKGYWNEHRLYNFNDDKMWEGKLLLEDDGWFEGIVNDMNSEYTGDRMVFGIYHPGKVIELIKVSPGVVSDPFVFRGNRDAKGYEGNYSVIGYVEIPCGTSFIITQDVDYLKENNYSTAKDRNIELEKEELTNKIDIFKRKNDYKELYEKTVAIRNKLSEYVLNRYNGNNFSKEQIEEILEPVQEKVEQEITDDVKKLVKRRDVVFFLDDDE